MQQTKQRSVLLRWFSLCPGRHILFFLSSALIGAYFLLRDNFALMTLVCEYFTRPWHRVYSRFCAMIPVSVAAVIIAALVIFVLVYIILSILRLIRFKGRLAQLYRLVFTLLTLLLVIYALFCLLWGVYYYTSDFESQSGLEGTPVSAEQLESVTSFFVDIINEYSTQVQRDESGCFAEPLEPVFERSATLYHNAEQFFPCLEGQEIEAKPFLFSKGMSYIGFTGFFFPFTGEANINVDAPACLIPSTIAHEIAHQRGVAAEDEANFVAVLSTLESGDAVYTYSGALLAYIHLSNALYDANYEAWEAVYDRLDESAKTDLRANNAYWAQFETPVSEASDAVYTGFLQSYGQELGLKSYGACVDLLVAYYEDISRQ